MTDLAVVQRASHSEVEAYLKCERSHFYSYGERITSKGTSDALARGIVGHAALATYYSCIKAGQSHNQGIAAGIGTMRDELALLEVSDSSKLFGHTASLFKAHCDHWLPELHHWDIIEIEKKYDIKITDTFVVPMVIDLLVDTPDGLTVIDHKFKYDFYNSNSMQLAPQLAKYKMALQQDGYNVQNAMYNEIRYRDTKDNKLDASQRFRHTPVPISEARALTTMREHILGARRIAELRSLPKEDWERRVLRVGSDFVCDRCSFKDICIADLNGRKADRELLLQFDYAPRKQIEPVKND